MPLVPIYTFVAHTRAEASKVNANFLLFEQCVNIAGDTLTGTLVSQTVRPSADDTYDLGTSSNRFKDIYISGTATGFPTVPAGVWFPYGGTSAPTGYLMCDGASYVRATYPDLFAAIGTTHGAVDGSHFNVPDMRGKFPFGKATAGTGSTLGATFGTIDHTHTGPSHTHSVTTSSHTHTIGAHTHTYSGTTSVESVTIDTQLAPGTPEPAANHTHTFSGTTSSDGSTTSSSNGGESLTSGASGTGATSANNPPGLASNFIIKY